jgi:formate hydrogenlyase subunit 3/multisubunit Na+/H+ antiporter MnhD subunit
LATILFFWEGFIALYLAVLLPKNKENPKTAVKALSVTALAALTLMLGVIVVVHVGHTAEISEIERIPLTGHGLFAFICIMLGSLGMMGCMPYHSWFTDAADDAPTTFLAAFPGALNVLLGAYLGVVSVREVFELNAGSGVSNLMIAIGVVTFVLGAAMSLVQKDLKKLLAYTSVSLSGFIAMGIGTGTEAGVSGAMYALINYVFCLSGLFIICGIIEKKTGTSDLRQLKGLCRKMPAVAVCFGILSLSALGFPLFGGFYAYQLILGAVLDSSVILYICAFIGIFLIVLGFFRLGRTLFFGDCEIKVEKSKNDHFVSIPVYILSGLTMLLCYNPLPLDGIIKPALNTSASFAGLPASATSIILTILMLIFAVIDHIIGYKKAGNALDSYNHISKAPVVRGFYGWAEKGYLDPYKWLVSVVGVYGSVCTRIEHGVSWVYDKGVPGLVKGTSNALHRFNNGRLSRYLYLVAGGLLLLLIIFFTKN